MRGNKLPTKYHVIRENFALNFVFYSKMVSEPKKIKMETNIFDMNQLPDEILTNVFTFLDIRSRLKAVQTCRRFHHLLTNPRFPVADTVSSLTLRDHVPSDLFEKPSIAPNFNKLEHLKSLLTHFGQCETLELKPKSGHFVSIMKSILENSSDSESPLLKTDTIIIRYVYMNIIYLKDLPVSTKKLYLNAVSCSSQSFVSWPEFLQLECLYLRGIPIPPTVILPQSLLVLKYNCEFNGYRLETLISHLHQCPNLEELEIGSAELHNAVLFRNFIHKIRDFLPNLRCLSFNECGFPNEVDVGKVAFDGWFWRADRSIFSVLEEANFGPIGGGHGFYAAVDGFLKTFPLCLKSVFVDAKINDMNHVYGLIPQLITAGATLRIRLGYPTYDSESNVFRSRALLESPPVELGRVLQEFRLHQIDNAHLMRSIFRCGSFERLTRWEFLRCSALDDEKICFIAKWCPNLENLLIKSCKNITSASFTAFVHNWDSIRSRQLIIECIDSLVSIDQVAIKMGIDYENGRFEMADGKRAELFPKMLPAGNRRAARLVIWEIGTKSESESMKENCKKMVVIRDYGAEELDLNIGFGIVGESQ